MQFGLGTLRLSPNEFWRSTPRELAGAFGSAPPRAMLRQKLNLLMEQFPDDE